MRRPHAHDRGARRLAVKILLAVDGSELSNTAVSLVQALTLPADSALRLITVIGEDHWTYGPWPALTLLQTPAALDRALADIRARLDDMADGLAADGRTISATVRHGRPASEIVNEADRFAADLVVVGARGHSAVDRLLLGSVSSEVVDQAHCPVLVVRSSRFARVLLATDGSSDGSAAAAFLATSRIFGEPVVKVVSVVDPGMPWWAGISPVDGAVAADAYADALDAAAKHARDVASSTAASLGAEHVVAEATPRGGEVGSTIVTEATDWQADIVALGTRSHGLLHRALVGSTSRHVLHHASMSVLIVRPARIVDGAVRVDAA
jgi:nucleotide-binding universal stress UspA family protein